MDFLRKKWSLYFIMIDVNRDGVITKYDVDKTLKEFQVVEELSEEEGKITNKRLEKWWNTYILKGRDHITKKQFVDYFETEYSNGKEGFIKTMTRLEEDLHDIINVHQTKEISIDTFIKALKVFGHTPEGVVRESFAKESTDGKILIQDSIKNWVEFLTADDETRPGIIMENAMVLTE